MHIAVWTASSLVSLTNESLSLLSEDNKFVLLLPLFLIMVDGLQLNKF